ncbi:MAG: hypothetical protein SGPRY_014850, partial [Prymnesium sp.]
EQQSEAYVALNPNAKTPTLLDSSISPPFAVFESNAILLYLARKFASPLLPSSPTQCSEVEQWLTWQGASLGPVMSQCIQIKRTSSCTHPIASLQFALDRFDTEASRLLRVLETRLQGRDYICGPGRGEYSLADIACFSWLSVTDMPSLNRWLDALSSHPPLLRGLRVPGVPLFGPQSVLFDQLRSDPAVREALEQSAKRAGRPFVNWLDLKALAGMEGPPPVKQRRARLPFWCLGLGASLLGAVLVGKAWARRS